MPSSSLEQLKRRIVHQEEKSDILDWADVFMHEYGLDLEGFKKLKIPSFFALRDSMNKRYERQNKKLKKGTRKRR